MKGNRELDELLISYLLKELDSEEEAFVIEQINSHEEIKKRFEALRATWKLMAAKNESDKIDINSEWKHFEKSLAKKNQLLVPIKQEEVFEDCVANEKVAVKRFTIRKIIAVISVAASLVLLVTFGWKLSNETRDARQQVAKITTPVPFTSPVLVKHEINNTGKRKKIVLPDGSQIILEDKSEVSYAEPFVNNRRDITLKGMAAFKVAKDRTKPFTVFSSDITTTALGTRFAVSAFEKDKNITVKLFEGKVVIKSATTVKTKLAYDYYLIPGQELVYNNKNYTATLSTFIAPDLASKDNKTNNKVEKVHDDLNIPEHNSGSWYMFNNQSARQAFEQLKILYNADIVYKNSDIRKLYIVIKFEKTDSLDKVLHRIASVNNLKVRKENSRFFISK